MSFIQGLARALTRAELERLGRSWIEYRATIGVARRVHIVAKRKKLTTGEWWASSLCGWAGLAQPTGDTVTCMRCRHEDLRKLS